MTISKSYRVQFFFSHRLCIYKARLCVFFKFCCQKLFGAFVFIGTTGGNTKYASVILIAALCSLLESWEMVGALLKCDDIKC